MLIDSILKFVKEVNRDVVEISRETNRELWLAIGSKKLLYIKSRGLLGSEYKNAMDSLDGFGLSIHGEADKFFISKKNKDALNF